MTASPPIASRLAFSQATEADAPALAELQRLVSEALTQRFGEGRWTRPGTERGVLRRIRDTKVLLARQGGDIVGTLALQKKKPWAIDRTYFTPATRCLYLLNMAVTPALQRRGIGRRLLEEADRVARLTSIEAICLDAFDAPSGAGGFYERCGYREVGRKVYRATPLIYYERLLG